MENKGITPITEALDRSGPMVLYGRRMYGRVGRRWIQKLQRPVGLEPAGLFEGVAKTTKVKQLALLYLRADRSDFNGR